MTRLLLFLLPALIACKEQPPPAPPPLPEPPASSQPASQPSDELGTTQAHEPTDKKNQIAYQDPRCSGMQPCVCIGTIVYGQNAIAKIGLTEEDLAKGTLCLLGDFDGNGHQDAAFVGKEFGTTAVAVQILLFDELGLRDTPTLPKNVATLSIHSKDGKVGLLEPSSRTLFLYQDGKFEMVRI